MQVAKQSDNSGVIEDVDQRSGALHPQKSPPVSTRGPGVFKRCRHSNGAKNGKEDRQQTEEQREGSQEINEEIGEKVHRSRGHKNTEESGLTKIRQGAATQGSGLAMVGAADGSGHPLRSDFLG